MSNQHFEAVLEIHPSVQCEKDPAVFSHGTGNRIKIERGCKLVRLKVTFQGNNNTFIIGPNSQVNAVVVFKGDGGSITVGKSVALVEAVLHAEYGTSIFIGEGGIFSRGLIIRTGDSHSVIDIVSGKRLNYPASTVIEPYVWAGYDVSIMKGVRIQKNTIIGAGTLVNKSIAESECIVAGVPAKVVRRGVVWDRRSLSEDPSSDFLEALLRSRGIVRAVGEKPEAAKVERLKTKLFNLFRHGSSSR